MTWNPDNDFPQQYRPRFTTALLAPRLWPHWLGVCLLWSCSWLPMRARHAMARPLGWLAWRWSAKRRHIADVNLRLCLPELDRADRERLLRRHFFEKMRTVMDYGVIWFGPAWRIRRLVQLDGIEHLQRCRDDDTPVILAVAHSLALDFGPARMTQEHSTYGMAKHARNPLADWLLQRGRTRFMCALHMRDAGLGGFIRAARRADSLFYLPDEDHGPRHSVFAPFFGVPKATLTAPARMARLTGARLIPAITRFDETRRRYVMSLLPPLDDYPSGDPVADATRLNQALETLIRPAPAQYLWTLRLFRTRPPGSATVYE